MASQDAGQARWALRGASEIRSQRVAFTLAELILPFTSLPLPLPPDRHACIPQRFTPPCILPPSCRFRSLARVLDEVLSLAVLPAFYTIRAEGDSSLSRNRLALLEASVAARLAVGSLSRASFCELSL